MAAYQRPLGCVGKDAGENSCATLSLWAPGENEHVFPHKDAERLRAFPAKSIMVIDPGQGIKGSRLYLFALPGNQKPAMSSPIVPAPLGRYEALPSGGALPSLSRPGSWEGDMSEYATMTEEQRHEAVGALLLRIRELQDRLTEGWKGKQIQTAFYWECYNEVFAIYSGIGPLGWPISEKSQ